MPDLRDRVATVTVRLDGEALDERYAQRLVEVRVDDHRYLPDAFLIRINDPRPFSHTVDTEATPLKVGAKVEVAVSAPGSQDERILIRGAIVALEPEFGSQIVLAARGYDLSHGLNRARQTRTFEQMSVADIVQKVADDHGLQADVSASEASQQLEFWQQNEETDLALLWRLARRAGAEVVVDDETLHFRDEPPAEPPLELEWGGASGAGAGALHAFRPRVTGAQQVGKVEVGGWDPKAKQLFVGDGRVGTLSTKAGLSRDDVMGRFADAADAKLRISDRPTASQTEAAAIASSVATQLADGYLEAEGTADGNPGLRAGRAGKISGVGPEFNGTYVASTTTHVLRGTRGYATIFRVTGRQERSLVDLVTARDRREWGQGVVVGLVTNTNDPDGLGRVRVKFPALGGQTESAWARVVGPGAGDARGLLWTPATDDEVLVAFEHDDVRFPYVLGALWNGKARPGALVTDDNSLAITSAQRIVVESKKDFTTTVTEGAVLVETKGSSGGVTHRTAAGGEYLVDSGDRVTIKGAQAVAIEGQTDLSIKGTTMTIEAQTLTIKAQQLTVQGQGQLSLTSSGVVQVSGSTIMLG